MYLIHSFSRQRNRNSEQESARQSHFQAITIVRANTCLIKIVPAKQPTISKHNFPATVSPSKRARSGRQNPLSHKHCIAPNLNFVATRSSSLTTSWPGTRAKLPVHLTYRHATPPNTSTQNLLRSKIPLPLQHVAPVVCWNEVLHWRLSATMA